jgi:acetolactate decarboxylase
MTCQEPRSPQLAAEIAASRKAALDRKAAQREHSTSAVVIAALARYLEHPIHTAIQVSTSGGLVAGIYDREVSVQAILEQGN